MSAGTSSCGRLAILLGYIGLKKNGQILDRRQLIGRRDALHERNLRSRERRMVVKNPGERATHMNIGSKAKSQLTIIAGSSDSPMPIHF